MAPMRRGLPGRVLAALALLAAVCTTSACTDFATDTPLGASVDDHVVAPGVAVAGEVVFPDGQITVTLAPLSAPARDGHRTSGELACAYDDDAARFSCPTQTLGEGLFVVQVTDAAQPGEGTALAQVALTSAPRYSPDAVWLSNPKDPDAGSGSGDGKVTPSGGGQVELSGWRPSVAVTVTVVDESGRAVLEKQVVPDASGSATLGAGTLPPGQYEIRAGDGLWVIGGPDATRTGTYRGFSVPRS